MKLVEILYRIMYKNMSSVLLDKFLDKSDEWTSLEQFNSETRTGWTIPKILTQKLESDRQQLPRADLTLSETKSRQKQQADHVIESESHLCMCYRNDSILSLNQWVKSSVINQTQIIAISWHILQKYWSAVRMIRFFNYIINDKKMY